MTRLHRFVGVLGWPLDHTLSPAIHEAAFRSAGLDWVYLAWPVPPESLAAAIVGLRALGAAGANVTMPHKRAVVDHLDGLSEDATALGAVNTIQRAGEQMLGHNTDASGFRDFLDQDAGVKAAGRSALVLGAGGSARAVVKALADLDAGPISVAARDPASGAEVAAVGGARYVGWEGAPAMVEESEIVVNATPVGMNGRDDPIPGARFRSGHVVVDLIYSPPTTPLMARARSRGADVRGGLGMLVRQAADSFLIWTGRQPSLETMSAAAVRAIGGHPR